MSKDPGYSNSKADRQGSQIRALEKCINEAMELLKCAGPNPLCIRESEYYERLKKLRKALGVSDNEDDEFER